MVLPKRHLSKEFSYYNVKMQEAEQPQVVLVLHSIGWHLHDCIITFINPAGENGKELCKQCGCSGRFVNARTLWLTENYCCTAARWVTIGTCVFCWSAKCHVRFVYHHTCYTSHDCTRGPQGPGSRSAAVPVCRNVTSNHHLARPFTNVIFNG